MSYMPNEIYVGRTRGDKLCAFEAKESDETKYIRADIAEARIAKLEDALRWYGDENNHRLTQAPDVNISGGVLVSFASIRNSVFADKGQRAREVLKDG